MSKRQGSPSKICATAGCGKPVRARGLCSTCYNHTRYTLTERRAQRSQMRVCETCGQQFPTQRRDQRFCSLKCRSGGAFRHTYTDAERRKSREHTRRRHAAQRAAEVENFTDLEIFERDRWVCQICHRRVSKRVAWPHPRSASLDHIIPLSEPGTSHTRRNVRLVHLECNTVRGNHGGGEQLALVG